MRKPTHSLAGKAQSVTIPKPWRPADSILAGILAVLFVWSNWPALVEVVHAWNRTPDYSHGYLVLPAALGFLWLRHDQFPGLKPGSIWPGLLLVSFAAALKMAAVWAYISMVEAWSIIPWIIGAVWAIAGRPAMRWALPSILLLGFMIPLPYRSESYLSVPMQSIAARVSCWTLQTLGQPAIAIGNEIRIGESALRVAEACSGLRIFISILALAYVYLVFVPTNRWTRFGIIASIFPIAIFSNSLRIVVTALLGQLTDSKKISTFDHNAPGFLMIPVAAGCFWCVICYLRRVFVRIETVSARELLAE